MLTKILLYQSFGANGILSFTLKQVGSIQSSIRLVGIRAKGLIPELNKIA